MILQYDELHFIKRTSTKKIYTDMQQLICN